jgi:hypothetical protein
MWKTDTAPLALQHSTEECHDASKGAVHTNRILRG